MLEAGILDEAGIDSYHEEADAEIAAAEDFAMNSPEPDPQRFWIMSTAIEGDSDE